MAIAYMLSWKDTILDLMYTVFLESRVSCADATTLSLFSSVGITITPPPPQALTASAKALELSMVVMSISMSSVGDATLVGFFFLNFIQIVTILIILIYAITDVYQHCNAPHNAGCSGAILLEPETPGALEFVGGRISKKVMDRYRKVLTPLNLGRHVLSMEGIEEKEQEEMENQPMKKKRKKVSILKMLKNGHDSHKRNIGPRGIISASRVDEEALFKKLSKDPMVYFSSVTSNYVKYFSPFRAKRFMTTRQLNSNLVYPQPIKFGTAFILPTGHVINKMYDMDDKDLKTWNPPTTSSTDLSGVITKDCATTDLVHRIGLYGFHGNEKQEHEGTVEFLVCNCSSHKDLLQAPMEGGYSSEHLNIQVSIPEKTVLLPGPGSTPIRSTQVTAAAHQVQGVSGEHDIDMDPNIQASPSYTHGMGIPVEFKPVYGTGLVNLPQPGAPLALNCPCTDRADGVYKVYLSTANGEEQNNDRFILQRDLTGYMNANPIDAARLSVSSHDARHNNSTSWMVTGNKITSITCTGERIDKIS